MKKETKTIEIFTAKDGTEFFDEASCKAHEEKFNNIMYYKSVCSPDLTEGRGYQSVVYIAVNAVSKYISDAYALQFMVEKYKGKIVDYVQGCEHAAMETFHTPTKIDKKEYFNPAPGRIGSYLRSVEKVFLSDEPIEGFPENTPVSRGGIV